MNLWAFGDSYMQYNENYIKDIAKLIGCAHCRVFGVGGSGLLYTYKILLEMQEYIEGDDAVLIGLTNRDRWLFGEKDEWHSMPEILDKKEAYEYRKFTWLKNAVTNMNTQQIAKELDLIPDEYYKAAQGYVKYILSENQTNLLAHSIVSSIIYSIVPSLPTKRVAVVRTLPAVTSTPYNIPKDFNDNPTLFDIGRNYLINNKGVNGDDIKSIITILNTRNHWIDEPEYKEYFFKEIDWVVNKLM